MKKTALMVFLPLLIATLGITIMAPVTNAVTGADWRAGRIIDDGVFTNPNDMSVAEIQAFLNSKVPVCDTWGTKPSEFGGGTRAQYAASRGYSTPFTCLRDYHEVPKTAPGPNEPASNYGGVPVPAGAQSAAQIISNAAHKYNISARVLLVKLATESPGPLTSDDWPFKRQYLYAMGAHCPDSGPGGAANCDANYAGFSLQMDEAADLMRWYLDNMTQPWWQYKKPYQTNHILWNVVERGCGGGDVYIENKATAALYTYTPYQPNQAALNNLYGTGDNCSAYGNRNFWRVFNDWFGDSWQWAGQTVYTNSNKTTPVDTYSQSLDPNTRYYTVVKAKNTGGTTWHKGSFRLGTTNPLNHSSAICDVSWINCGRPATLVEDNVAPGETGTFEFWFATPGPGQDIKAYFNPLQENIAWLNDLGMHFVIKTNSYTWEWAGQAVYTDATKATAIDSYNQLLEPGTNYYVSIKAKNTGTGTWTKNDVKIGTTNPLNHSSAVCNSSWINCGRPATLVEDSVAPGQTGTFEFLIKTPGPGQSLKAYFNPLKEGVAWMNDIGMHFVINTGVQAWEWAGQAVYTDATKATAIDSYNQALAPNTRYYATVRAKNSGTVTWRKGTFRLGTTNPLNHSSAICDPSWINCGRPATLVEDSVAPGQTGTFEFWFTTPGPGQNIKAYFNPLQENVVWLNDIGMHFVIKT